ncbi:hypothetical protein Sru01_54920 [Sphaerisporangium rufum]|uniref:Uncharacterized protein n=1 Tax=Sphaerisporangium rufum TaxID=1381558 RepID=A0A919RAS3_9ACTN|nr:hypothetical protein Sru01_54920 [Sphaerisporangium rufum]
MRRDGAEVAATQYMANQRIADRTGAQGDDATGCPAGTVHRIYRVTGDFGKSEKYTVAELADLAGPPLRTAFRGLGYESDKKASSGDAAARSFAVLRKENLGITFTVTVRLRSPNIEIAGRTDCLSPG